MEDIRWKQRFDSYQDALAQLQSAVVLANQKALSDLEKQGVIKCFEYTYEMAWNTLKDFLEFQGVSGIFGPKDTVKEAFKRNLIRNGDIWLDMIKNRNRTVHTYNREVLETIYHAVCESYFDELRLMSETMTNI